MTQQTAQQEPPQPLKPTVGSAPSAGRRLIRILVIFVFCAILAVGLLTTLIAVDAGASSPDFIELMAFSGVAIFVGVIGVIASLVWAISARRTAAPPKPAGYTADGRPFYPVVGYTPEGTPITADQAPGYKPPSSGTNSMAITAFILAFTFAILAVPFGHMARSQIRRTGEGGGGLALAALIIGYLNVAVLIAVGIAVAVMLYGNV